MQSITAILYSHKRPPAAIAEQVERCIYAAIKFAEDNGVRVQFLPVTAWDLLDRQRFPKIAAGRKLGDHRHSDGYTRILAGLQHASNRRVAILEHDVLYPMPYLYEAAKVCVDQVAYKYNQSVYRWHPQHGFWFMPNKANGWCCVTSNLVAHAHALAAEVQYRASNKPGRIVWGEPGVYWQGYNGPRFDFGIWESTQIAVDIRYGGNMTGTRTPKHSDRVWQVCEPWGGNSVLSRQLGLHKSARAQTEKGDA